MPTVELTPKKVQESIQRGKKRLEAAKAGRMGLIQNFVGPMYGKTQGEIGAEPLNLSMSAIRVLLPNIVMNFPKHVVRSNWLDLQDYGEILSLALTQQNKELRIQDAYRCGIVEALFSGLGIYKTGIAAGTTVHAFNEYDKFDPGQIFTACVNFDSFVVDGQSREYKFADAVWMGEEHIIPRKMLLDSGEYNNELIEKLPVAGSPGKEKKVELLSKDETDSYEDHMLYDEVAVYELWVPGANAVVTVPAEKDVIFDDYLRIADYYGPDTGPYTFLSLTPPVPGNPLPVALASIWNDIHILANRMTKKISSQAENQKDVVFYKPANSDDAETVRESKDGDLIAVDDPTAITTQSFGGQQPSNVQHLAMLNDLFNQMAANPQALAGNRFGADSATEAKLMQANANVGLEDMKDAVYTMAAEEGAKRAWYIHTNPFIQQPLIRTVEQPAVWEEGAFGPVMKTPAIFLEQQVILTPEVRRGDWLDFSFDVEPESMGRQDSQTQQLKMMEMYVQVIPAIFATAQQAQAMGVAFNPREAVLRECKNRGIRNFEAVFADPEFALRLQMLQSMGPQQEMSKALINATVQNGQPGEVGRLDSSSTKSKRAEQSGANQSQREIKQGY